MKGYVGMPESGGRGPAKHHLAARATMRLRQLIAGGGLDLRIPLAFRPPGASAPDWSRHQARFRRIAPMVANQNARRH
jgi:hypothetical protein